MEYFRINLKKAISTEKFRLSGQTVSKIVNKYILKSIKRLTKFHYLTACNPIHYKQSNNKTDFK